MIFISAHASTHCIRPILICVSYKEEMGWVEEGRQKCLPDNLHVQLCIGGREWGEEERAAGRLAGCAGQRKEEQMHCGGRRGGGGPTAIVHVLLWTKGSSGSVCKPTAGFSPLTRPHAGQNTTDRLPQFRPYSHIVSLFEFSFFPIDPLQRDVLCWYVTSGGPIRFYARSVHTVYHHGSVNINFLIGLLCR